MKRRTEVLGKDQKESNREFEEAEESYRKKLRIEKEIFDEKIVNY